MPRYRVLETSYIGERIVEAGAEVEYDGRPGKNLEPIDKAAEKAKREAEATKPAAEPTGNQAVPLA